jgi:lysophospholipase L1-like esterase
VKINKNIALLLASTFITLFILAVSYETYENIRYSKFKSFYRSQGDLYGNLTIASSNRILIWEYKPYGECRTKTKEYKERIVGVIQTNRYGFRDFDYESVNKPSDTYRIAFIGDSVTLGLWVDFDKTFVKKFEILANQKVPHQKIQALNFSVDGYNTVQIYELLQSKVLPFSPNKVIYMMCLNDFDFNEAAANKIYYFKKPKMFMLKRLRALFMQTERSEKDDYYLFHFKKNKNTVFHEILNMRNSLTQKEIAFLVVILPVFDSLEKGFDEYKYSKIHTQIDNFLKKNKIQIFDLLRVFMETNQKTGDFAYDVWHPNEEGHQIIADELLKTVLPEYLLQNKNF